MLFLQNRKKYWTFVRMEMPQMPLIHVQVYYENHDLEKGNEIFFRLFKANRQNDLS